MPIVSNYTASGHVGEFSTTSGIYTISGDLTTDAANNIVTIKGNVTVTSTSEKVTSFNLYFVTDNDNTQNDILGILKAVHTSINGELNNL